MAKGQLFRGTKQEPREKDTLTIADLGIHKKISARCRKLAKQSEAEIDKCIEKHSTNGEEITPSQVIAEVIEKTKKKDREAKLAEAMARARKRRWQGTGRGRKSIVSDSTAFPITATAGIRRVQGPYHPTRIYFSQNLTLPLDKVFSKCIVREKED